MASTQPRAPKAATQPVGPLADPGWVAVDACTLPTAQQPLRAAEFDTLFTAALRGVERPTPTRLRLEIDAPAEQRARELAARESDCCGFFTFTFTPAGPQSVWMDIGVPSTRTDVLDGLALRARTNMPE